MQAPAAVEKITLEEHLRKRLLVLHKTGNLEDPALVSRCLQYRDGNEEVAFPVGLVAAYESLYFRLLFSQEFQPLIRTPGKEVHKYIETWGAQIIPTDLPPKGALEAQVAFARGDLLRPLYSLYSTIGCCFKIDDAKKLLEAAIGDIPCLQDLRNNQAAIEALHSGMHTEVGINTAPQFMQKHKREIGPNSSYQEVLGLFSRAIQKLRHTPELDHLNVSLREPILLAINHVDNIALLPGPVQFALCNVLEIINAMILKLKNPDAEKGRPYNIWQVEISITRLRQVIQDELSTRDELAYEYKALSEQFDRVSTEEQVDDFVLIDTLLLESLKKSTLQKIEPRRAALALRLDILNQMQAMLSQLPNPKFIEAQAMAEHGMFAAPRRAHPSASPQATAVPDSTGKDEDFSPDVQPDPPQ